MFFPDDDCEIEPPDDPCPWLWETAEAIREAAWGLVEQALPAVGSGCEPPLTSYVAMGAPVAEMYDAVSVHLVSNAMTPDSARLKADVSSCGDGIYPRWLTTWRVELWLNGYPSVRQGEKGIYVPSPERLHAANQWLYALGNAMHRGLSDAQASGQIEVPNAIDRVTIGSLSPLPPQGQAVGWRVDVVTETR